MISKFPFKNYPPNKMNSNVIIYLEDRNGK